MFKIIYDSELFQQCSYSTLSQGTNNLDLADKFVSKCNATLPCCADKISQNLQKVLFLILITSSQQYSVPSDAFLNNPSLHMTTVESFKKVLSPPSPFPMIVIRGSTTPTPCHVFSWNSFLPDKV